MRRREWTWDVVKIKWSRDGNKIHLKIKGWGLQNLRKDQQKIDGGKDENTILGGKDVHKI